jgi:hypothetical protein
MGYDKDIIFEEISDRDQSILQGYNPDVIHVTTYEG